MSSNGGKFFVGLGIGCAGMIALPFFGFILMVIVMPNLDLVTENGLSKEDMALLQRLDAIGEGEELVYLTSTGLFGIDEGASLFTTRRVAAFGMDATPQTVERAHYSEIHDIDLERAPSWMDNSVITVTRDDGSSFVLLAVSTDQSDRRFFDRLVREWRKHRPDQPAEAPLETAK